jgi:hypothetical protein
MNLLRFARALAAASLGLVLSGAPALAATPSPAQPPVVAPAEAHRSPLPRDQDNAVEQRQRHYAEREAAAPHAADFKGNGVGVYIGGSTLAVVLIVVLVVVLL